MEIYTTYFTKQLALAKHLKLSVDELDDVEFSEDESGSEPETFTYGQNSYLVLTDEEATKKCKEYIKDTLWNFNPTFLQQFIPLSEQALQHILFSENAIPIIEKLLGNQLDDFIESAINCDGRGHFLASYDGVENEEDNYFIYKL